MYNNPTREKSELNFVVMPMMCCAMKLSIKSGFNFILAIEILLILCETIAAIFFLNFTQRGTSVLILVVCYLFLGVTAVHAVMILKICMVEYQSREFRTNAVHLKIIRM
jgi:hypothetical protein